VAAKQIVENMPVEILLVEDNTADVRSMREVSLGINNGVKLLAPAPKCLVH
jgi:hypothetical protein